MDKDAYIKYLEKEHAELKKRIEELEQLLGMNPKNSSKQPSSDPPGVHVIQLKRRHKKRGAKKGYQPHLRQLFEPEKVTYRIELKSEVCPCGGADFEECDQEPMRHQIVDIPPIIPAVTEYLQQIYRCKDCGELVHAPLPDKVKHKYFGPGLLALVAILTGVHNTSKHKASAMMNEVFSIPMSLGGLSNCEVQLSAIFISETNDMLCHWKRFRAHTKSETLGLRGTNLKSSNGLSQFMLKTSITGEMEQLLIIRLPQSCSGRA